jgi:type I restriction enzyme S subunit
MTFRRYPRYKDSGVEWLGEVPEHWPIVALKRIAALRSGDSITSESISESGKYPVVGGNGLRGYTAGFTHEGNFVVIGRQGALCGNVNYATGKFWASEHAVVATPNRPVVTRWLGEMLRAMNLNQYSVSAAQPGLSVEAISKLRTMLPPHSEQLAIASFLDSESTKIDALVAEQQRLIALLKEKRQAVISHAVTRGLDPDAPMKPSGVEWLGDVPAHWEVLPIKRVWSVTDCKHITAEFVSDGYPLASIREVQGPYVSLEGAKRTTAHYYEALIEGGRKPEPGDLIFSRNATVGEVAQVTAAHPTFAMGQDVCLLRPSAAGGVSDFVQAVLKSDVVGVQIACLMIGSTFKRINVEEIRNLLIPFPPHVEQQAIASFVQGEASRLDCLVTEAERAIALLQERRTALISAAVTGKIDVRGLAGEDAGAGAKAEG